VAIIFEPAEDQAGGEELCEECIQLLPELGPFD
jgi:hypothetical protein